MGRVLAASALFLTVPITLLAGDVVTVRPKEIDDALVNPGVGGAKAPERSG